MQEFFAISFQTNYNHITGYSTKAFAYLDRFESTREPIEVDRAWELIESLGFKKDIHSNALVWR